MSVLSNCNMHTSVKIADSDYVGLGWNKRVFISNKIQVMSRLLLKMGHTLSSKALYHTTFPNSETQAVIFTMARVLLIRITFCVLLSCVDNLPKQSLMYYLILNISPFFSILPRYSRKFGVAAVEDFFTSFFKSDDCVKNQQLCSLVSEKRKEK